MKHSKLPVIMALLSGSLLMACASGEIQKNEEAIRPTALTLDQHAMVNGTKDFSEAHKAVVSLYLSGSRNYSEQSICTGTLIHPQWVITAAHCVTDEDYRGNVTAGSHNPYIHIGVGNTDAELKKNLHAVEKIYFHEGYGESTINSQYSTINRDIALIKLSAPIPESEIKPILPLPSWLGINRAQVKEGVQVEFVGFGYATGGSYSDKLSFSAPLSDYCGTADNDPAKGCEVGAVVVNGCHPDKSMCNSWSYYSYCTNGQFCLNNYKDYVWLPQGSIYYEQDDGGPCQGDSGGPAFVKIGGVEYVAGLTSYGDSACAKTGISTAVQDYTDWILSKAPELANSFVEVCGNGYDDDNNGFVDDLDPACGSGPVVDPDPNGGDDVDPDPNGGDDVDPDPNGGDDVDPDPNGGDDVDPDPNGGDDAEIISFVEGFDGIGSNSNNYLFGSFLSANTGVLWSYFGRTGLSFYAIDGEGLILKDGGYVEGLVHNGVGTVSVQAKKAFTSIKSRKLSLSVNGEVCNTISLGDSEVVTLSCDNVNLSGDVRIRVSAGSAQVTVDNLSWTSHK